MIPMVTVSPTVRKEDSLEGICSTSPLGPSNSGCGRALTNLSVGAYTTISLSDVDISRSSLSTPPIVVLKTLSDVASRTNTTFNSRPVSPPSEIKASVAGTELSDKMVDELTRPFGKDMQVLSMFRPYDVAGEFTLDFVVLNEECEKVSLWARAPTTIECVSLSLSEYTANISLQPGHLSGEMHIARLLFCPGP
jgi:hypothetical protein